MVKIGNIKVDLRSGAAALQERTRTHAHARIGFYIHFPACCVCFFRVLLFAASTAFSDVVLPCLLTVWACCGGVWSVFFCFFMLFVSVFIYVLSRFQQKCKYSLRRRIDNDV